MARLDPDFNETYLNLGQDRNVLAFIHWVSILEEPFVTIYEALNRRGYSGEPGEVYDALLATVEVFVNPDES